MAQRKTLFGKRIVKRYSHGVVALEREGLPPLMYQRPKGTKLKTADVRRVIRKVRDERLRREALEKLGEEVS